MQERYAVKSSKEPCLPQNSPSLKLHHGARTTEEPKIILYDTDRGGAALHYGARSVATRLVDDEICGNFETTSKEPGNPVSEMPHLGG